MMHRRPQHMTFTEFQKHVDTFFDAAITTYGLENLWQYVCQNNTSGSGHNYHSTRHMREVTSIAFWLLLKDFDREVFGKDKDQNHAQDEVRAMLAACMIHDMDHSLGHQDDAWNINTAIDALVEYVKRYGDDSFGFVVHAGTGIAEIERNIRTTQFPYQADWAPATIYQQCIRDADILYSMQDNACMAVLENLRTEMSVTYPKYAAMSRRQFLADRLPFIRSCEMFTPTGRSVMSYQIQSGHHERVMNAYIDNVESK